MKKKASIRSQRGSRGIKGKHILQICVLLGVCIWLIYQVKYSHDKKTDKVLVTEREDGLVKLGRKDLLPGYHNQKEEEEEEKDIKVENGDDEIEEEKEEEDEVVEEDEEDDIDEQDQSKTPGDKILEEEEDKRSNKRGEKEKETNNADEIDMTIDEAHEEHYKADDASSAVSLESPILKTEKLKESSGNSNETAQENNSNAATSDVGTHKEPILKLGKAESGDSVNKTTTKVKDVDRESASSETKSAVTESQGGSVNGNLTTAHLEASLFSQNETEIMRDRSQEGGAFPGGYSDPKTVMDLEQTRTESDLNITTVSANITNKDSIQDESKNSGSESSQQP